jgi:hypothetical protein
MHSLAYAVLKGRRGQRIGELLQMDVTEPATGCLNCHSMHFPNREGEDFSRFDGVSCENTGLAHIGSRQLHGANYRLKRKSAMACAICEIPASALNGVCLAT